VLKGGMGPFVLFGAEKSEIGSSQPVMYKVVKFIPDVVKLV
jgi:hypothetical protein